MGEYEPKIEVQFPEVVPVAKSTTVKLECFALGKYVTVSHLTAVTTQSAVCLLSETKLHFNLTFYIQAVNPN